MTPTPHRGTRMIAARQVRHGWGLFFLPIGRPLGGSARPPPRGVWYAVGGRAAPGVSRPSRVPLIVPCGDSDARKNRPHVGRGSIAHTRQDSGLTAASGGKLDVRDPPTIGTNCDGQQAGCGRGVNRADEAHPLRVGQASVPAEPLSRCPRWPEFEFIQVRARIPTSSTPAVPPRS